MIAFHIYSPSGSYVGVSEGYEETGALLRAMELYSCDPTTHLAFPYFMGHRIRV